ncbi:MAG: thioredoxin family protein [Bacteroidales bacterium]|nr:thioredoxin family protein [Bacteroidales bacterium]
MDRFILTVMLLGIYFCLPAQNWEYDYDIALLKAKQENKTLTIIFQGSDWCSNCIKLEHKILNTGVFQKYAADNLILLKADFPKRKQNKLSEAQQRHNNKLAERYNTEGYFPLLVLVDDGGSVIGKMGNKNVKPQAYIDELDQIINH